jgi:flagellar hook assembly protein FlgD
VAFALPTGGRTRIALYDVSGREVRVLADAELRAGPQQFVWDGRDSDGRAVASGVYLCRIAAGGETTLGSIAVIR